MREIKFRAKNIHAINANKNHDGEWVYGLLCGKGKYIEPENSFEKLIDVNTIGQYTGLKDKNGKEIYEGEIVIMKDDPEDIGSVAWDSHDMEWVISMATTECKMGGYWSYELEVIGNIYDNPELLEASND